MKVLRKVNKGRKHSLLGLVLSGFLSLYMNLQSLDQYSFIQHKQTFNTQHVWLLKICYQV